MKRGSSLDSLLEYGAIFERKYFTWWGNDTIKADEIFNDHFATNLRPSVR